MHHNSQLSWNFETFLKVGQVLVWLFGVAVFVSGLVNFCFLTWDKKKHNLSKA